MPLNSLTHDTGSIGAAGELFVVATPIGNMEDITLRALKVLTQVAAIAAEDTRHTAKLLSHYQISTRLISYHEHNEQTKIPLLIQRLLDGDSLALVTDAGTPGVSDPGYRLVKAAVARRVTVVPVPGVSAVITALSVAGLPTDSFVFVGFPAKKSGRRKQQLQALSDESRTIIFYESPKRIMRLLSEIREVMGDRQAVLSREMTKLYEEFLRGRLSDILLTLEGRQAVKGECTLLVAGRDERANDGEPINFEQLYEDIHAALSAGGRLNDVSKELSRRYGIRKREVYDMALKIKGKAGRGSDAS